MYKKPERKRGPQKEQDDDIWAAFGSSSDDEKEEDNEGDGSTLHQSSLMSSDVCCFTGFEIIDYDNVLVQPSSVLPSSQSPARIRPSLRRGVGVRATTCFQRGEEILREAPTLRVANCHAAYSQQQAEELHAVAVQEAYDKLSHETQRSIMQLSNCGKYHTSSAEITNQLLQGIYQTNSYRLMDDDGAAQTDGGIFLTIARFNHSCRPNISHYWRPDLNRMIVFAIRPIAVGEELLISYLRPSHWMTTVERRQILRQDFCFHCMCDMCNEGNDTGGDDRMKRLARLYEQLTELVEMGRHEHVIQVVHMCLHLMEQQGIGSALEQTVFFHHGYHSALQLQDYIMANSFLDQELQSTIFSQGKQSPMAEQLRRQILETSV
jgi:hypothetical protein